MYVCVCACVCMCVCACVYVCLQRGVYGHVAPVSFMYGVSFSSLRESATSRQGGGGSDRGVSRIEIAILAYSQSSATSIIFFFKFRFGNSTVQTYSRTTDTFVTLRQLLKASPERSFGISTRLRYTDFRTMRRANWKRRLSQRRQLFR